MKEDIRNYTSSVPIETSIMRIEKALVKAGATHISKSYESGDVKGVVFQLKVGDQYMTFKLPAREEAIIKVFSESLKRLRAETLKKIKEQAGRTAWRILHEWVELQCTMIKLEQAEAVEIFLPYAYDMNRDMTLFEKMKSTNYKALLT